jgi:hypothetical protein
MTVLNLHKKECLEIAKGVLKTNIDTPILAKTNSYDGVNYVIFIDGEKLAENLKLKVKSSLKKSVLSDRHDKYCLELDFDNPYMQNISLYFEKIIESAVFYIVPESISENKDDLNWFKKVIYENGYSKEELRKEFGIIEFNPKLYLEFLDLTIASPTEVETVFRRRTTRVEAGRIQQYILPHEIGYEPPVEIVEHYLTSRFERIQPVQFLSKKPTTITETLSKRYTCNNFFGDIILNLIHREKEHVIEYQTYKTIAEFTVDQFSFVNWARVIVETVDKYIRRFNKLYYTEEELEELFNLSRESVEYVYLIEFYGRDQDQGYSNRLVKAERLKKILADGSLLGQKEEIELKQTSKGLEVKDTDIERLERSYQEQGFFINAVSLEY